jgi:hypothetical protein
MDFIDIRPLASKWFSEATPQNYKTAKATLGSGDNGTITIIASTRTTDDVVSIVVPNATSQNLSAAYADGKITVSLATDGSQAADATKNTAKLIAEAIDDLDKFTASASGTGETAISAATSEDVAFEDGQWGTPCQESGVCLTSNGRYYVNTVADNTVYNANWKMFTLTSY